MKLANGILAVIAISSLLATGCTSRYSTPYSGYSTISPPGTYAAVNPYADPYYRYQANTNPAANPMAINPAIATTPVGINPYAPQYQNPAYAMQPQQYQPIQQTQFQQPQLPVYQNSNQGVIPANYDSNLNSKSGFAPNDQALPNQSSFEGVDTSFEDNTVAVPVSGPNVQTAFQPAIQQQFIPQVTPQFVQPQTPYIPIAPGSFVQTVPYQPAYNGAIQPQSNVAVIPTPGQWNNLR